MEPAPAQEALAFEQVLEEELKRIRTSRKLREATPRARPQTTNAGCQPRSDNEKVYCDAYGEELIGLAFSGGGIRSATFNLGILQGLAKWKMLSAVDYLSTVSGGGYIGSWLHAWVKRSGGIREVAKDLAAGQEDRRAETQAEPKVRAEHTPEPIQFLRRYANYLTPRTGLLSTDTWTMISIWIRNTLLNQIILFLALASLLLLPRVLKKVVDLGDTGRLSPLWPFVLMVPVVILIGLNLSAFARRPTQLLQMAERLHEALAPRLGQTRWFHQPGMIKIFVVAPVMAGALLGSSWFAWFLKPANRGGLERACLFVTAVLFLFLFLIGWIGGLRRTFARTEGKVAAALWVLLVDALVSIFGGAVLYAAASAASEGRSRGYDVWHVLAWGTPGFLALFMLVVVIYLGLLGRHFPDDRREWWSRLGGTVVLFLLGWVALFSAAIYGPLLVLKLHATLDDAWSTAALMAWAGTVASGLWAADSSRTGNPEKRGNGILGFAAKLAPPVFIGGIIVLLSVVIHRLTLLRLRVGDYPNEPNLRGFYCPEGLTCPFTPASDTLAQYHFHFLSTLPPSKALLWAAALMIVAFILAWRVDINEFSLHQFYRNRLVRCYLGASRKNREPNLFTGFDPEDGMPLAALDPDRGYAGPYPIINTALNLVHGENLAWQERKAESFVFTPAYCGYDVTTGRAAHENADRPQKLEEYAYRPTRFYSDRAGPGVGQSMAISGAAASPNMGHHTSAATAFLMTVFDVRLGWWIGNPRHKAGWTLPAPRLGLFYLVSELMGLTNDRRRFVYLSDGGHFENLAIYELIRRRCRYIIACDAEQDVDFKFEGLGNAIRKCRTDFNVEIDVVAERLQPSPETGFSGAHCVVGVIRYPERDSSGQQLLGTLVYIKASLTGDEPTDVLEHRKRDATFPHTSTADQWFSESQFESYRRLGLHVANSVFRNVAEDIDLAEDREGFFRRLRQQWYPPSKAVQAKFTQHTRTFSGLLERLRQDPNLRFMQAQISPEWPTLMDRACDPPRLQQWLPQTERELRAGFMICNSVIQIMENVYIDLNLEEEWNHPDNRGWVNVFNQWVWSSMFRATWAASAASYGARFQTFCQKRLKLELGAVDVAQGSPEDLNDFEREQRYELIKEEGDTLWNLVLRVDNPAVGKQTLTFRFGFALVDRNRKLAFYRVQNHLRKMGLWTEVEPVLWEKAGIVGADLRRRRWKVD